MNKKTSWMLVLIVMSISFIAMTGCRSKVKQSGFLTDYPEFEKGPKGGAELAYFSEGADFSTYDKIMMDHVVFYFSKDSNYKGINSDELKKLSDAFHKAMVKQLQDAYPFVSEPGPGVLRMRPALTDVKSVRPVMGTIGTVLPVGLALSIVKKGVTGTHMNVGGATIEAEFLDSQTNKRVAAIIDQRSGTKYKITKTMTKWGQAEDIFNSWAKRLRKVLDDAHGK